MREELTESQVKQLDPDLARMALIAATQTELMSIIRTLELRGHDQLTTIANAMRRAGV